MQKVYLLLRDNKQSGPYSLDELLQMGLKPFDLIWIEGKSLGWAYPSEISALKPYVPEASPSVQPKSTESMPSTPTTYSTADTTASSSPKDVPPPKSVFVSLPGKGKQAMPPKEVAPASDWDRRVEELRQRAQACAPKVEPEDEIPELNTNYSRSLDEVEDQYTNWVYKQKTKKKPLLSGRQIAVLAIVVLMAGGGYLAVTSQGGNDKKAKEPSLVIQQDQSEETPLAETEPENATVAYEQETQPQEYSAPASAAPKETKKVSRPLTTGIVTSKPTPQKTEAAPPPVVQQSEADNTVASAPAEEETVASAPRKKTLADKIDSFIEKIASKGVSGARKEEVEDGSRTGPAPGSGERRSTRRGEEGAPVMDPDELARQVDVVANNSDNWMMGVKGLKLTVRNNSPVTIRSAAVEVSYYSESDDLLDKKTVYVSNIPSKGRKTVAAPDQRMADHVELKVLSVSADDEAYAQQ